ncbi:MAG TPA: hypothetical protein VGP96_05405 [Candidatus Dormibacteraeota bacterium]|nr:hypothetical protein [Candidatus Dormibacteraeota bacterium]
MTRRHALLLAVLGAAAVSCGSSPPGDSANAGSRAGQGSASPTATTPANGRGPAAVAPVGAAPGTQAPPGWKLTVYYTAVESFHHGNRVPVTGCDLGANECSNGSAPLGSYPDDFVARVKDEGTGRITSGKYAGKFLAWDAQGGFSLDTSASDAAGNPLRPFISAAADDAVPLGTHLRVLDCGVESTTRQAPTAGDCGRLTAPDWLVTDRNGNAAGSRELNLYVGEEDRADFENAASYVIATINARTSLP